MKELVINTQYIKSGLVLARKVALGLKIQCYYNDIDAISAEAMLRHQTNEVELEIQADEYGEPCPIDKPIIITRKRVDSFHTFIGISPEILLRAQLQGNKMIGKLTEKCGSVANAVIESGECLAAVAELQYAARTSLRRNNGIGECENRLRHLELEHRRGGKLLLQSPTVEAGSLTNHFAQERQLANRRSALNLYKAKTTNHFPAAKQRAEERGISDIIQAAALISAWKQAGIPEQNIQIETNGATLIDHAILNLAGNVVFTK